MAGTTHIHVRRFVRCLGYVRQSSLTPPPPIKKVTGFTRFGKVTLTGSGGVRTPGPPRPATGLGGGQIELFFESLPINTTTKMIFCTENLRVREHSAYYNSA